MTDHTIADHPALSAVVTRLSAASNDDFPFPQIVAPDVRREIVETFHAVADFVVAMHDGAHAGTVTESAFDSAAKIAVPFLNAAAVLRDGNERRILALVRGNGAARTTAPALSAGIATAAQAEIIARVGSLVGAMHAAVKYGETIAETAANDEAAPRLLEGLAEAFSEAMYAAVVAEATGDPERFKVHAAMRSFGLPFSPLDAHVATWPIEAARVQHGAREEIMLDVLDRLADKYEAEDAAQIAGEE